MNQNYREWWVGQSARVTWPALSPDLTPVDFYLLGTVTSLVYATSVDTREELKEPICNNVFMYLHLIISKNVILNLYIFKFKKYLRKNMKWEEIFM